MARNPTAMGANAARAWIQRHGQLNDRAVATTFAERYDAQWRYNADEAYWLQWVGTHWAKRQTLEFLESLGNFTVQLAVTLRRFDIITATEAVKLQSQRSAAAVERICRGLPMFLSRSVLFDNDSFLLGTPGGTVDLRTGVMRPADPEDYITVLTPVTPAPAGELNMPMFQKFLDDITAGDKDFQRTLQQWAGISACGTARDQRIFFLYGPGGNGKGVWLRTVAGVLGDHAVNAPNDLLMLEKYSQHATHLIDVVRARMALCTEVDDDATWDVKLIKDLTGGDLVSVNRMRQDPFRVKPSCSITISGNKKPALKGIDDAVRRRFLVGTFYLKLLPEQVIPDFEKVLIAAEGPEILRWVIDGAVAREAEGRLHVAKCIRDDTEDYFAEENVLEDFIATFLESAPEGTNPEWRVKTSEVYQCWRDYCGRSGRQAGARNSFTTAIQACGVKYHRANDGRYFLNVRIRMGHGLNV